MKSRTLTQSIQQPPHISSISSQSPAGWREEQKIPARSRLVDSYKFIMDLINAEPFPVSNFEKKVKPVLTNLNVAYRDTLAI